MAKPARTRPRSELRLFRGVTSSAIHCFYFGRFALLDLEEPILTSSACRLSLQTWLSTVCAVSAVPWEEASLCCSSLRKRLKVISRDINHSSSPRHFHGRRFSCVVCRFGQCTPSQLIRASANSTTHPDSWPLSCLLLLSVQSPTKSWHKAYRIKMFSYHMVAQPPFAPLLTST